MFRKARPTQINGGEKFNSAEEAADILLDRAIELDMKRNRRLIANQIEKARRDAIEERENVRKIIAERKAKARK